MFATFSKDLFDVYYVSYCSQILTMFIFSCFKVSMFSHVVTFLPSNLSCGKTQSSLFHSVSFFCGLLSFFVYTHSFVFETCRTWQTPTATCRSVYVILQLYSCTLCVHFVWIMSIIHKLLLLNATDEVWVQF